MFTNQLLSPRLAALRKPYAEINDSAQKELNEILRKIDDNEYQFKEQVCGACDGTEFLILSERERYGIPIKKAICQNCGLVQTNPDMREEDYKDFYKHHYRDLYFGDLVGTPADLFEQQIWKGQVIREFVTSHVQLKPGAFVLEVGCGAGGILDTFRQEGYRVVGIDFGAVNLNYAKEKGIEVYEGNLKTLNLNDKPDLIIYSHVFEHIKNIHEELKIVRNLLADDGVLYIEVPGILNTRWNTYQADLLKTFHVAHIYDFSLKTLCNVTRKNGFNLVFGNEYIRSIHKKGDPFESIENDFECVYDYLVKTEKYHKLLGIFARAKLTTRAALIQLKSVIINLLKQVGIYSQIKGLYRNLS